MVASLGLAGSAGAYVVPAAAPRLAAAPAVTSAAPDVAAPGYDAGGNPLPGSDPRAAGNGTGTGPSGNADTGSATSGSPAATGGPVGRPVDALANWAQRLSGQLDIPVTALQAYGYAELVVAQTRPGCKLRWTTLAGIGKVESDHGRANHAVLQSDGRSLPSILGPVLDGTHNTTLIKDTDQGRFDGDSTYDRAVGPMQFIPSTWLRWGVDADADGFTDPNDINDAAMAAANYLCSADRNLSTAADWWGAILSYNQVAAYARDVFDAANTYGTKSRDVT